MNIPFLSFNSRNKDIREEILEIFENFFDSEYYVLGNFTKRFEDDYSNFCNTEYCVGVSNGLDALHLALKSLDIKEGDEIIVPANTYIATVLAISLTGALPVFVEPNINTFNIDPDLIEKFISPKTKAIIPVHLYGQPCEMDKIMVIAKKYNLYVIEDNAQAHGAVFEGQKTGSFGDINATSFYPTKNLGALGEAGALTTNNNNLYEKSKMLRNYGSQKRYYNEIIGYNNRIDECQAAFLKVSLKYLDKWTKERQQIASWYNYYLAEIPNITLPFTISGATHVYHLYVIKTKYRNQLQAYLTTKGIGTLIHYPIPPHLQTTYSNLGYKKGDFPIAEELAENCLSLPLYMGLKEDEIVYIANNIKSFVLNAS